MCFLFCFIITYMNFFTDIYICLIFANTLMKYSTN